MLLNEKKLKEQFFLLGEFLEKALTKGMSIALVTEMDEERIMLTKDDETHLIELEVPFNFEQTNTFKVDFEKPYKENCIPVSLKQKNETFYIKRDNKYLSLQEEIKKFEIVFGQKGVICLFVEEEQLERFSPILSKKTIKQIQQIEKIF